jgi:CysZ protein
MLLDMLNGFVSFFSSLFKIGQYKICKYIWLTLIVSMGFTGLVYFGIFMISDDLRNYFLQWYPFEFGKEILMTTGRYFITAILYMVVFFFIKYILLIVLSPFMSKISERVEETTLGLKRESSLASIPNEIIRSIGLSSICLWREMWYSIPLVILSFVPVLGLLPLVILFLVQAYYVGIGCYDFYAERYFGIKDTLLISKRNKGTLIGIGAGFNIVLMIPVLGVMFAPLLATITATEMATLRKIE